MFTMRPRALSFVCKMEFSCARSCLRRSAFSASAFAAASRAFSARLRQPAFAPERPAFAQARPAVRREQLDAPARPLPLLSRLAQLPLTLPVSRVRHLPWQLRPVGAPVQRLGVGRLPLLLRRGLLLRAPRLLVFRQRLALARLLRPFSSQRSRGLLRQSGSRRGTSQ